MAAMQDHRELKMVHTSQSFSDLKAYEFKHESKRDEEPKMKNVALVADQQSSISTGSNSNPYDFLIDEQFACLLGNLKGSRERKIFKIRQLYQAHRAEGIQRE